MKITLLLIYAKINDVYHCISLQLNAGSWPLQSSKFRLSEKWSEFQLSNY